MPKGPNIQNLIETYIRPINKLRGESSGNIEAYFSKLYMNPSDVFLYTMPRLEEKLKDIRLTKVEEENLRMGFAQFSNLGQILFERKFPEYYHRADKAPPKQ